MLGKENKFQLAFKAQYLPIVPVVAVEHVCLGICYFVLVILFIISNTMRNLILIAFSCINVYLYPQDRISGPWSDGKWHCLQLTKDGSHCHCLEPDCREGRHVVKPLLNIQLPPVSHGIICQ